MELDLFRPLGRYGTRPSVADRIDASGDCWEWTGATNAGGYGIISRSVAGSTLVHRVVYETLVGPIEGLELDHRCQNKVCVNPSHLEPVDRTTHLARTFIPGRPTNDVCKRGHPYDDVYEWNGVRHCRPCRAEYMRKRRHGIGRN